MSDDLVKRLRSLGSAGPGRISFLASGDAMKAADRIEKLEAALAKIAQHDMQAIAMDALRPGDRIRKALDAE